MTTIRTDPEQKQDVRLPPETAAGLGRILERELAEAYWTEKTFLKTLNDYIRQVHDRTLADALNRCRIVVDALVGDLESTFQVLGREPFEETCEAMDAHFRATRAGLEKTPEGLIRDCAIGLGMQKGLYFNIAVFTTLVLVSEKLGLTGAAAQYRPALEGKQQTSDEIAGIVTELIERQSAT